MKMPGNVSPVVKTYNGIKKTRNQVTRKLKSKAGPKQTGFGQFVDGSE